MNRMLVGGMLAGALELLAGTEGFGESIMQSLRKQGVGTTPRQRLYERFKDQGLEILAVDLQEDRDRVQSFVKELGLTFTVLLDTSGTVGAQYAARAIPTTYLLDRKGFVFARMVGSREWDTPEMLELVTRILKDELTTKALPAHKRPAVGLIAPSV